MSTSVMRPTHIPKCACTGWTGTVFLKQSGNQNSIYMIQCITIQIVDSYTIDSTNYGYTTFTVQNGNWNSVHGGEWEVEPYLHVPSSRPAKPGETVGYGESRTGQQTNMRLSFWKQGFRTTGKSLNIRGRQPIESQQPL